MIVNVAIANLDSEVAVFTPTDTPGVCYEPKIEAGGDIETPTDNLEGLGASNPAIYMVIDATLVVEKVSIDIEVGLNWAEVEKLVLYCIVGCRVHKSATLALVFDPR